VRFASQSIIDMPAMMSEFADIVMYGAAPWNVTGPLNCHHVARRLARKGHRVLYVEPFGLRRPHLRHPSDLKKIARRLRAWLSGAAGRPHAAEERLWVLSPYGIPIESLRGWNASRAIAGIRRASRRLRLERPVLWTFLPTGGHLVGRIGEIAVIYHCVDDYAGNPGVNTALLEREEEELLGRADLCFATSRPLVDRLRGRIWRRSLCGSGPHPEAVRVRHGGPEVVYVPNVAEVERFETACGRTPPEVAELRRPIIGYVGNIASYKLDVELLASVARRRPDWTFLLIGPLGGGDPSTSLGVLEKLSNVRYIGARPHAELPRYVQAMDVGMIPFVHRRVTESSLPLKTFEFLAAGTPLVATSLQSLRSEPLSDAIRYGDTPAEFVTAIENTLDQMQVDGGKTLASRCRAVASRYRWSLRFPEICGHLEHLLADKATSR